MPAAPFFRRRGAQIRDMNKPVLLTFTDVDEGRINSGEDILDSAEINITDLVTTLGNDQFINPFIGEHRSDAQLLRDDNLLGHKWT
mgnify:CR=1 FL=1